MSRNRNPMEPPPESATMPTMPAPCRRGFTLIEVLVSIMIFVVVSSAMIGILLVGTELFQRGEFSRAANDETVAVVGAIEDDLKHLVPKADGGWLFSAVGDTSGNCVIAFTITNPDPSAITSVGANGRLLVAWWVNREALHRATAPLVITTADPNGKASKDNFLMAIGGGGGGGGGPGNGGTIITTGCLHFGVWLANLGDPANFTIPRTGTGGTQGSIDWDKPDATKGSVLPPWSSVGDYDTDVAMPSAIPARNWPFPAAMRISLVLTGGGRFGPKGFVVSDDGNRNLRIGGIGVMPTSPGSMLRVDPAGQVPGNTGEWIAYSNYASGAVSCERRGARRSAPGNHAKNDVVRLGQSYSIVRSFPQ